MSTPSAKRPRWDFTICYCLHRVVPHHKDKKYIVYHSCLMELFRECPLCQRPSHVSSKTRGTMIIVEQTCTYCDQKVRTWRSQPMVRHIPAGNIQLSSAIYIAGESLSKFERVSTVLHTVWVKCNIMYAQYYEWSIYHFRFVSTLSHYVFKQVFKEMNVAIHNYHTFRRHSKAYVEPAIVHAWHQWKEHVIPTSSFPLHQVAGQSGGRLETRITACSL